MPRSTSGSTRPTTASRRLADPGRLDRRDGGSASVPPPQSSHPRRRLRRPVSGSTEYPGRSSATVPEERSPPNVTERPPASLSDPVPSAAAAALITAGGYVFPVYGPSGYGDTSARRGATSRGWHHGDDIFAPLGAPILAVADGIVFSVGWNTRRIPALAPGRAGNQFYYAHLSAYTPLARERTHVHAGDVLGFVGNTGDAGGDAVPPPLRGAPGLAALPRLRRRRRSDEVPRCLAAPPGRPHPPAGVAWAPQRARAACAARRGRSCSRRSDISTASGLDPGSLRRALDAVARRRRRRSRRHGPAPPAGSVQASASRLSARRAVAGDGALIADSLAAVERLLHPLRVSGPVNGLKRMPDRDAGRGAARCSGPRATSAALAPGSGRPPAGARRSRGAGWRGSPRRPRRACDDVMPRGLRAPRRSPAPRRMRRGGSHGTLRRATRAPRRAAVPAAS